MKPKIVRRNPNPNKHNATKRYVDSMILDVLPNNVADRARKRRIAMAVIVMTALLWITFAAAFLFFDGLDADFSFFILAILSLATCFSAWIWQRLAARPIKLD